MRRHIADTHTMRWEIYVHPQSGRMLLLDTLRQVAARGFAAAKIVQTDMHR